MKKKFCPVCELHHRGHECSLQGTDSQLAKIASLSAEVNLRKYNDTLWQDGIYSRAEAERYYRYVAKTEQLVSALRITKRQLARGQHGMAY